MNEVRVPARALIAPFFIGIAILSVQSTSPLTSLTAALMIALAGVIHMTAMALRDAEFRALTAHYGLNNKDCFAYGCMVFYDACLLFGLVSGAGLLLDWKTFLSIAGAGVLIMPCVLYFALRRHYNPETALDTGGYRHWMPPVLLIILAFAFLGFGTLQTPDDAQPYFWLVLFSVNLAATDPATRFERKAHLLRYALFAGLIVILLSNYLDLT